MYDLGSRQESCLCTKPRDVNRSGFGLAFVSRSATSTRRTKQEKLQKQVQSSAMKAKVVLISDPALSPLASKSAADGSGIEFRVCNSRLRRPSVGCSRVSTSCHESILEARDLKGRRTYHCTPASVSRICYAKSWGYSWMCRVIAGNCLERVIPSTYRPVMSG